MKILAIETSCDDTGIAVIKVQGERIKALSNIVSSQQIHANYGGVFPMMAKREHQRNLVPVLEKSLEEAKLRNLKFEIRNLKTERIEVLKKIFEKENELFEFTKTFLETHEKPAIDAIAVTYGPGLEPCLWVGVNFARALSYFWDIPLIPVNHIEAHILVNFLECETWNMKQIFPAIALVVSGGHTQLILVKEIGNYEIIGETRDDAAGECFDKAARILQLGYPGGPIISKIAAAGAGHAIKLPRPMLNSKDYDFSFSGLKTAVLYEAEGKELTQEYIKNMAAGVQDAIVDVLLKKTLQAAKDFHAKTIILGGGVSANQELRKQFTQQSPIPVIFPEPKLSTDNGLMIAVAGCFNNDKKIAWQDLSAHANLRIGN